MRAAVLTHCAKIREFIIQNYECFETKQKIVNQGLRNKLIIPLLITPFLLGKEFQAGLQRRTPRTLSSNRMFNSYL